MAYILAYDIPFEQMIIPSPFPGRDEVSENVRYFTWRYFETVAGNAAMSFDSFPRRDIVILANVFCREHRRMEMLPNLNYGNDLCVWYDAGLHPRFSILKALLSAKQTIREIMRFWIRPGGTSHSLKKILEESHTPEEFLKNAHSFLFTYMTVNGRRYRVRNAFREKFKKNAFTVKDFLLEGNHELRRLMLRHGVDVKDVLAEMRLIAEDDEGRIYEFAQGNSRYLYVVCPSTSQEYLLEIPHRIQDAPGRWDRQESRWIPPVEHELVSPKEAKRWTFGLPKDAKFVRET